MQTIEQMQPSAEQIAVLRQLRDQGCAVCVFLPHEMPNSAPEEVEDAMCQAGWNRINFDAPDGAPVSV